MDKEPAVITAAIVGAVEAVLGVLVAFGLDLSDAQRTAVLGAVAPLVLATVALGPIIRRLVYSPHTVKEKVRQAHAAGAMGRPPPKV